MPWTYRKKIDAVKRVEQAFSEDLQKRILPVFETEVKKNTPVQTGRLKGSVIAKKTGPLSGEVATNVTYAPYIEFGTIHIEPRAMFRKGAASIEKLGNQLIKSLRNVL